MTDKQKQAITVLNRLYCNKYMDNESYFSLLDFVTECKYCPAPILSTYNYLNGEEGFTTTCTTDEE